MASLEERIVRARVEGPDDAVTRRARAATLAIVAPAQPRAALRRRGRLASAGIAIVATGAVAAGLVAVLSRHAPRVADSSATQPQRTSRAATVGGLRGVRAAPLAPALPAWLEQIYRGPSGPYVPAGPARRLVVASGPDHDAIDAWPTRDGGLALATPTGVTRPDLRQSVPLLLSDGRDDATTPSGIGVLPGRHRALLYGLVPDDVVAVDVKVAGRFQRAALSHDAFAYQLPRSPLAGSFDAVRITRRDGTTQTLPTAGHVTARPGAIVLTRGQSSSTGKAADASMLFPASWHPASPPRAALTTRGRPRIDLIATSTLVASPLAFRDGCPLLPASARTTTTVVIVAQWPTGSGPAPGPAWTWAHKLALRQGAVPCWPGRSSIIDLADQTGRLALRITVFMAPHETELLRRETRAVVESVGTHKPTTP